MEKAYHHGDLRKELIRQGLLLLNKDGYAGLSMRKVAVMCGVSHAAPYNHFANKDELIAAINDEVQDGFTAALEEAVLMHPDDPKAQIVEMGKRYVKFMVDNPDFLRFMFLNYTDNPVKIRDYEFNTDDRSAFNIFRMSAMRYFASVGARRREWVDNILTLWSLVHGLATLIAFGRVDYGGDCLELVEAMVTRKLALGDDTDGVAPPDGGRSQMPGGEV